MAVVNYARYSEYKNQRTEVNNTIMGLLAGSRLASQTLILTEGSKLLLSDIFPNVEYIKRFNLTTESARKILNNADNLLGILAVPQILALQEDLISGMLDLIEEYSTKGRKTRDRRMVSIHEDFESLTGISFTPEYLQLFHFIRLARNTHIHSAGKCNKALSEKTSRTTKEARKYWENVTKSPFPSYKIGEDVKLGVPEMIGILAITHRLSQEANEILQKYLPESAWINLAIDDWSNLKKPGDLNQQIRSLKGFTRHNYKAVGIDMNNLEIAYKKKRQEN